MAQGLTRKEIKHDEVLEAAQDLGDWLEVHWKRVLIALAAGFGTLVLVLGWQGLQAGHESLRSSGGQDDRTVRAERDTIRAICAGKRRPHRGPASACPG